MTTSAQLEVPTLPLASATYADWRAAVENKLKGVPLEKKLVTRTPEGIDVQPLYLRAHLPASVSAVLRAESIIGRTAQCAGGPARRWEISTTGAEFDFSPLPALALAFARPSSQGASAATADPLGWLASHGSLPMPVANCIDDLVLGMAEAEKAGVAARLVGIGAHRWHECGATAVQELAFALATGAEYWRGLLDREMKPDQIAARTELSFAVGVDFFMEIAKLRAARVVWTKMTGAFNAGPAARRAFITARTALWDKTLYDPHVNLLRVTTQALSAVAGGADAIDIRPFDEATGEPTELGHRLSRNLHDLLAEEFLFEYQVDPAGGSWYVEQLTDQLARKAWTLFQEIEKQGGMTAALLAGYPQSLVGRAAEDKQALIDTRRRPILGTTVQPNLREDPQPEPMPVARRGAIRRSPPKPITGFSALVAAARRVTLATLRSAWTQQRGSGPTAPTLLPFRAGQSFEAVRRTGDDFLKRTGKRARVFLAKMGPPKQHKGRADFSSGFFTIAGFEIDGRKSFTTADEAAAAAVGSGAAIAVLCSTDDTYPQLGPAFARASKAARPSLVMVLAGPPGDHEQEFRGAGFDEFIHVRSDVRATLAQLQRRAGILP